MNRKLLLLAGLAFAGAATAQVGVSVNVAQPGLYGRIDIGSQPPPPVALVYPQPVVIAPAPVARGPIYLHVPPGHAKHWSKHCAKYGACNQPVYFVRDTYYQSHYAPPPPHGRGDGPGRDHDRGRGHDGKGHGKGHGHGKHD